nr:deoxyribonuclease-2-beta [Meriones unguiculatus]
MRRSEPNSTPCQHHQHYAVQTTDLRDLMAAALAVPSNATAYLLYNDGVPKSVTYSKKYGHTKGVLVWNRLQGFWLIHSVPWFPPVPEDGYSYPSSGRRNAQNGICITFKYDQFEEIDSQLLVSQPNIYSCFIPTTFHWELIYMPKLCAKSSSSSIPRRRLTILQSVHGHDFLHFAKSGSYSDDIFTAWMAQQLKTHLLVQTWQRKRQELPSNCSLPYHVYNVKIIQTASKYYFSSHLDHSKWCVSTKDSKNHWTCIGDLNRSPTQASRSGGFICTRNPYLYQSFHKLVFGYEFCN